MSLLGLVEVALLAAALGLCVAWVEDPKGLYEPQIVLCTLALFGVDLLRRKFRDSDEDGVARSAREPRAKSPGQEDAGDTSHNFKTPLLLLSDGVRASLEITISYRVVNVTRATYAVEGDPALALMPRFLSELRKRLEPLTFELARAERGAAEEDLKRILSPDFDKYGLALQGVILGAMEPRE